MIAVPGSRAGRARAASQLVDELVVAIVNARIYWPGHRRVAEAIAEAAKTLRQAIEDHCSLTLGIAGGCLVFDRRPLLGSSLSASKLIAPLAALGAGGIEIDSAAGEAELQKLVELLVARRAEGEDHAAAGVRLKLEGCTALRLLPPYREAAGEGGAAFPGLEGAGGPVPIGSEIMVSARLYQGVVDLLQTLSISIGRGACFSIDSARAAIESILARLKDDAKTMLTMARYERYDAFTFGHSVRVCFLALNFVKSFTGDPRVLLRIGLAALLHDIGKCRIPFEILHSPRPLTPDERLEMEKHAAHGAAILAEVEDSDPVAVAAAFGHHLAGGRGGYPKTVHEARQSFATKVTKICDVYEALTAVRPYKAGMTPLQAYRVMLSMDGHFDPALLRRFIEVNGVYPVGTVVELSDGSRARVHAASADPLRPVVGIESDDEGGAPAAAGRVIDLSTSADGLAVRRLLRAGGVEPLDG